MVAMTVEQVKKHIRDALDGIELLSNAEREHLINWADQMAQIGMWGLPGVEIFRGIHNKCVLECRTIDSSWNKAGFAVDFDLLRPFDDQE